MEFPLTLEQRIKSVCAECSICYGTDDLYYCYEGRESTDACEKIYGIDAEVMQNDNI